VPIQSLEIEHTRSQPENPDLDGTRHDARRTGDARQRGTVDKRLRDRVENHFDAGHFPGQRFARKHALAVPTTAAS
jgi:hypothetical protein